MFGPNYRYDSRTPVHYDHRGQSFEDLVEKVRGKFASVLGLHGWDILFIPGPASLAMQIVLSSVKASGLTVHGDGKFDRRWKSVARASFSTFMSGWPAHVWCLLETSTSFYRPFPTSARGVRIVDAVSAFPYYQIPDKAEIFATTCCKQLGAPPGLSIVGVRDWSMIKDSPPKTYECWDYLDLRLHAGKFFPTTVNPAIFEHLDRSLTLANVFSQQQRIKQIGTILDGVLDKRVTIGQRVCPVITLDRLKFDRLYPGIARKYDFYPGSSHPETDRYHVFTYSEPEALYLKLIKDLRCSRT